MTVMISAASLRGNDEKISFNEFIERHWRYSVIPAAIARHMPEAHKDYTDYLANPISSLERRATQPWPPTAPTPNEQMPTWPEKARGVPNCILRSALFGVVRRGRRVYQERVEKATLDSIRIIFTGPMLDQCDMDVWEQCLHLARNSPTDQGFFFSVRSFLLGIGRKPGGASAVWLKASLSRLCASVVEIQDGRVAYAGPLLHHVFRHESTGGWGVVLNPAMGVLFREDSWTATSWEQRIVGLKGNPLAQWLHGFYMSHARPFPYRVATIHRICGSESAHLYHFRSELKSSLARLSSVTGWHCEIAEDDMIYIQKRTKVMKKQPKRTFSHQ